MTARVFTITPAEQGPATTLTVFVDHFKPTGELVLATLDQQRKAPNE